MGSWNDLDANYPPEWMTPATVLLVALGKLAKASSAYAEDGLKPASFLPKQGIGYDPDLLRRVQLHLNTPLEAFIGEATQRIRPEQAVVIIIQLMDRQLACGERQPEKHPLVQAFLAAFALTDSTYTQHRKTLGLLYDFTLFQQ